MSKKDKLFTEELARRNPDWDKFVAVHKDLHRKLATTVEALKEISGNDCMYCDCQENSKIIADRALEATGGASSYQVFWRLFCRMKKGDKV